MIATFKTHKEQEIKALTHAMDLVFAISDFIEEDLRRVIKYSEDDVKAEHYEEARDLLSEQLLSRGIILEDLVGP